ALPGGPQDGVPPDSGGSTSPTLGGPRFMPSPLHTIVIVELPTIEAVVKALEQDALPSHQETGTSDQPSPRTDGSAPEVRNGPPISIAGRSLPLLFIRASDGVGYHSGRTITCDPVYSPLDLQNMVGNAQVGAGLDAGTWMAAAQAAQAAVAENGLAAWQLRVM
ncbi:hypothetical protein C0992_001467, partial [Termitomyces sp. T32_za158]